MGFDVVVSDVDTVWLHDPLPYLAKYPEADILVSSDSLASTTSPLAACGLTCLPPRVALHIALSIIDVVLCTFLVGQMLPHAALVADMKLTP